MDKLGVLVCGHGSRSRAAAEQFASLATELTPRFPGWPVEHGYLEFAEPVLRDRVRALKERGVERILAVPGMLFAAGHAKNDIPSVLNQCAAEIGVRVDYGRELGVDPNMIAAAAARIEEALDEAVPREETLLVVVGRGASDPDANANVAKVTRLLWEGFGFGWAETAYSGVTFPLVRPALERAARLGFRRIVVFPYFLFTGVLVRRIRDETRAVADRHPEIEFRDAPYLGSHPRVIDTFEARVREILTGENVMNCRMCVYRAQVLGFEDRVGQPQESHHHHVEGVGASCPLCDADGECTGRCDTPIYRPPAHHHHHAHDDHDHDRGHHDHGHHHAPYPHAEHPLGPASAKPKG